jgi:hypothetical protein
MTDEPLSIPLATDEAAPGDWLEVHGLPGTPPRRGVILEVLGARDGHGHVHYRVRWDEEHVSRFFPGDGEGVHLVRRPGNPGREG